MGISAIAFLLVIAICVISHEFGHFVSARLSGVQVHEFAFGMGPTLFSRKRGTTVWSVRLVPIGGFVRLAGMGEEQGEEETLPEGLFPKNLPGRGWQFWREGLPPTFFSQFFLPPFCSGDTVSWTLGVQGSGNLCRVIPQKRPD